MYRLVITASAAALAAGMRPKPDHWAVLVSGSNGYGNYRHHADVCHAYQLLISGGVPDDHIITMFYDDVANDPSNPFPGQLFNRPTHEGESGVDVYAGCKKSYTGNDVTPANFLAVLTGNASAVTGGTGEVLKSGPNDFVFWAFFDHGAAGLVAFPSGGYLYQPDLWKALDTARGANMWKQFVAYIEACESGSMFDGYKTSNELYVTTAANPSESSWGTYCPPDDTVDGKELGTCLGDLYSVNWMYNAEEEGNMKKESLQEQYEVIRTETNLSHVMQYGTQDWTDEPIGDFMGNLSKTKDEQQEAAPAVQSQGGMEGLVWRNPVQPRLLSTSRPVRVSSSWDARLATLASLQLRASRTPAGTPLGDSLRAQLRQEQARAARWDAVFHHVAMAHFGASSAETVLARPPPAMASWTEPQWACYKAANLAVEEECSHAYGDYGLRYARVVAHMCTGAGAADASAVAHTLQQACRATAGGTVF